MMSVNIKVFLVAWLTSAPNPQNYNYAESWNFYKKKMT